MSIPTPPDNYGKFLVRVEAAITSLGTRLRSVEKAIAALSLLHTQYQRAVRSWEQRIVAVDQALLQHGEEPHPTDAPTAWQRYQALAELHDTAAKMESKFRAHVLGTRGRLSALEGRRDAIRHSLQRLEDTKATLDSSRRLSRDRQNLTRISYELAGSVGAVPSAPDMGLGDELKEARAAVLAAEALIEVKEGLP